MTIVIEVCFVILLAFFFFLLVLHFFSVKTISNLDKNIFLCLELRWRTWKTIRLVPWIIIIVYLGAGITIRTKKVCDVGIKVTRIIKLVIVYWLECVIKRS